MSKNYLFIDDSGSKQWETPYSPDFVDNPPPRNEQNRNFWQNNYFVLAGVHINSDLLSKLNPDINDAKERYFGTKHVEIRSSNLRNPQKQKKHYLDKYGITREQLQDFIEKHWYKILEDNKENIQLQAFVLDKRYYLHPRKNRSCIELVAQCLFDRVELHPSRECEIVFDQMDAEIQSTQHEQGKIVRIANKEVDLSSYRDGAYSHTSVAFEKSDRSNLLQLADTVAYNVLRQFVDYGDSWEESGTPLEMYSHFAKIADNFYHSPHTKQVKGFGIIKLPDPDDVKWKKQK